MASSGNGMVNGVRRFWLGLTGNLRGAAWMVAAVTGFTLTAALVKTLSLAGIDAFQSSVARSVVGLLIVLPMMARRGGLDLLKTRHPRLHLLRAVSGAGAMVLGYYAYTLMPLVEVTAISFSTALFVVILAVLVLREVVGWRRWGATLIGFLGVLVMLRPGAAAFAPEALLPVGMAVGFAVAVTVIKILPREESQLTLLFYFFVATILLAAPLADWRWPQAQDWLPLIALGPLGAGAQAMIITAFKVGEASFVAPFEYTRLILAWLIGLVFFAERPDLLTLAGAALIVASTLYIARREARLKAGEGGRSAAGPAGGGS